MTSFHFRSVVWDMAPQITLVNLGRYGQRSFKGTNLFCPVQSVNNMIYKESMHIMF